MRCVLAGSLDRAKELFQPSFSGKRAASDAGGCAIAAKRIFLWRLPLSVAVLSVLVGMTPNQAAAANQKVLTRLDADGNGLYNPTERKALLAVLQKIDPQLKGTFDANGDGKVTIREQTRGRNPLSVTIPRRLIVQSNIKIPWSFNIFPEWVSTVYLQEDVNTGRVGQQPSRGTIESPATFGGAWGNRPVKKEPGGGIQFAANSGQHFAMPGQRDAQWNYRWLLFTFRINAHSGKDRKTVLLDINHGHGPNRSSPKIWYDKASGLNIQYVGWNKGGLDRRLMTAKNVVADGRTWNVVVCGIRYGQMFAIVNGVRLSTQRPQPAHFAGKMARDAQFSYIGDKRNGNMAWAYDAIVFGLTEPSEAMVRKMVGWAAWRLGFQNNLPSDFPYRDKRPVLDAEDFPHRYVHNNKKWLTWGRSLTREAMRSHAGEPRFKPQGFVRVFYDDFRAYRISPSTSGEGDLWQAPGFNKAVGNSAKLVTPGHGPNIYPYNAAKGVQALSLVKLDNRWYSGAFYSVNDSGHGYTWAGPKIFRIRCKFPKKDPEHVAGGLFPAFWAYDPDYLFWRTANRIEVDFFEWDGKNGWWLNGLSSHYHYAAVDNIFAKNDESYQNFEIYGGELTQKKSNIPGGLFIWDGQFHTWEFVLGKNMIYVNVTIRGKNGNEKWVEIFRAPTPAMYMEPLDLQLDYALRARDGVPKHNKRLNFIVDWIEVLQKKKNVEAVPALFTARPRITGSDTAGSTITCDPNIKGITHIRYYWFTGDGYPLTWGPSNTYTVTAAAAGEGIRCMVKAVGALDRPQAWSNTIR